MWIKVQDEDVLIETKLIYLNKTGRGNSECVIIGKITGNTTEENMIVLGTYNDYNKAKVVFDDIQDNLLKKSVLFVMP